MTVQCWFWTLYCLLYFTNATLLQWIPHEQTILGENPHDLLGWSVAISPDGTVVAVGAIDHDTNGSAAGQVKIYNINQKNQEMGMTIHGEKEGDYLGYSVSLNMGPTLAIGAAGTVGKIRVFQFQNYSWTPMGSTIQFEQQSTMENSGGLGHVVALSDDGRTLVAGAPYYDRHRGMVLIFHYDSSENSWKETSRLLGEAFGSQFGYSVAMAANILAVGAKNHGTSQQGQVQVFHRIQEGKDWALVAPAIHGDNPGDYFGFSLSLSAKGQILAVGSPYATTERGRKAGLVRVYELLQLDDDIKTEACSVGGPFGTWMARRGQDLSGDKAGDLFGYSISLSSQGNRLAVGARQVQDLAGQVTIYDYDDNSKMWEPQSMPIPGEAKTDQSGFSVALSASGETLVIGSPYHGNVSHGKKPNVGQVRIYHSNTDSNSASY
jgi:WD40 repeat protein